MTEKEIKGAMLKDFKALYVKEFTTDWESQRFLRELEIKVMGVDNLLKLFLEKKGKGK
jgi:hypothetical protein